MIMPRTLGLVEVKKFNAAARSPCRHHLLIVIKRYAIDWSLVPLEALVHGTQNASIGDPAWHENRFA